MSRGGSTICLCPAALAVLTATALAFAVAATSPVSAAPPSVSTPPTDTGSISAHDPQFGDKRVWPNLTGKEAFVSQKWEKLPLYVWAHPGKSALDSQGRKNAITRNRDPGPDRDLPENWLVDGKPATKVPEANDEVDLLLPASDMPYRLAAPGWKVRHVTVERGAALTANMKVEAIKSVSGNFWIKEGGRVEVHQFAVIGANHAFFRNDNPSPPPQGSTRGGGNYLAYWITIAKTKGGSLEFLGDFRMGDELKFNEGTTVVGPDSKLLAGPPSIQIIGPEAVLELQSGAMFGKHSPTPRSQDILIIGQLRAGSPDRPITADATVGLNAKARPADRTQTDLTSALATAGKAAGRINDAKTNSLALAGAIDGGYSLAVSPSGKVRVYSADPTKSRLRFVWNGVQAAGGRGSVGALEPATPSPDNHVVALFLSDDVVLDGVVFDDFFKGGIWVSNRHLPGKWKNVTFGPGNAGSPNELFTYVEKSQ